MLEATSPLVDLSRDARSRLDRGDLLISPLESDSGLHAIEVETVLACPPRRVYDLMTDYERLPAAIAELESTRILRAGSGAADVEFTMKLPFPVGRICWTNRIEWTEHGELFAIAWNYIEGDLVDNTGRLTLAKHGDDKARARYQVRVATRSRLPQFAQRRAVQWLLPKVVKRIRAIVESPDNTTP